VLCDPWWEGCGAQVGNSDVPFQTLEYPTQWQALFKAQYDSGALLSFPVSYSVHLFLGYTGL